MRFSYKEIMLIMILSTAYAPSTYSQGALYSWLIVNVPSDVLENIVYDGREANRLAQRVLAIILPELLSQNPGLNQCQINFIKKLALKIIFNTLKQIMIDNYR